MKVLLGIGGSDDSFRALSTVIDRTAAVGDDLTVAILRNPVTAPDPTAIEERVETALTDAGVTASVRQVEGDPGSRLVEIAEAEGFDAIALGGGQESPMGKIRPGDIAEFVILNARTTVMLVR